jgi:hypothetical protein
MRKKKKEKQDFSVGQGLLGTPQEKKGLDNEIL